MDLIKEIVSRAQANKQRIVLPEGTEERTLKAANQILTDEVADLILLGNRSEIEEAAKKYSNDCRNRQLHCEPYCIVDFISGAEWQSKQSPWISVNERLPEELESVLVGTNYEGRYYYEVAFVMNGKWVCHNSKPIYWMPIPSFDEILEANRDVLERIKEKGD